MSKFASTRGDRQLWDEGRPYLVKLDNGNLHLAAPCKAYRFPFCDSYHALFLLVRIAGCLSTAAP
jgi:hypothetical protein